MNVQFECPELAYPSMLKHQETTQGLPVKCRREAPSKDTQAGHSTVALSRTGAQLLQQALKGWQVSLPEQNEKSGPLLRYYCWLNFIVSLSKQNMIYNMTLFRFIHD